MENNNNSMAFIILIGGKSVRFGSDKGIYEFLGKPLILYQIEKLLKYRKNIFLVAHSQQQIEAYKKKIVLSEAIFFILDDMDKIEDSELRTPMIGIYSGFKELSKLDFDKAFTISCDTPFINDKVIELMIKQSKGYDCCIPRWENGYYESLFAIYPVKETLTMAEKNLRNNTYKLTNLLNKKWKINYISVEKRIKPLDNNLLTFININGPIDIDKLMK